MSAGPSPLPALPEPRGGLSACVIEAIGDPDAELRPPPVLVGAPLDDDDLHLALYACYELHYHSFAGVADRWEWDPALLGFRAELECAFMEGLRAAVPMRDDVEPDGIADLLFELAAEDDGPSVSSYLQTEGTIDQFREFVIHRSAYQLKEADPHTWAIPRLRGAAKAAMVEIQADEYGSGRPDRVHSTLFAKAMDALGLDSAYGAYVDRIPGATLATVNLISRFGLHRELRGALTGHLAMFEITSPVPNRRYAAALRRFGAADDAIDFFDEHVEADSVHEQVAARDLAQGLALAEPALAAQIVFGAEALLLLESRWGAALLAGWEDGGSSLREARAGNALSRA
ncbi:MAG TPA: iron-containing redox enzyme family protein [Solirubrobacterales bacterium]